jgi:hypothetical protein
MHRSRVARVCAKDQPHQLGPARTLQSCQPDNLAGADRHADVVHARRPAESRDVERGRIVGRHGWPAQKLLPLRQFVPEHGRHEVGAAQLCGRGDLAVGQCRCRLVHDDDGAAKR